MLVTTGTNKIGADKQRRTRSGTPNGRRQESPLQRRTMTAIVWTRPPRLIQVVVKMKRSVSVEWRLSWETSCHQEFQIGLGSLSYKYLFRFK